MTSPRPLPPRANLHQLRNQAKDLCRACRKGDPEAIRRIKQSHPKFICQASVDIEAALIVLADAQLVIAREFGFDSWIKLKRHVESLSHTASRLHELVIANDQQALRSAIAQDPDSVNRLNELGLPPLYTAALYRNRWAIDFLLDHHAEVDLFACAYLGKAADADVLLTRDPELVRVTTSNQMTALHYAAEAGHHDVVKILLRFHSDVNAVDHRGETALVKASHAGPWKPAPANDIVQLLLDHGAEMDLFLASALGRTDLMEPLLDRDSSWIDRTDDRGRSALFHAARNNQFAAVKLLIERGADVNRSDAVGIAALHRASQECSDELIQYLIAHGANAHLCCYVACGDEVGTRRVLATNLAAANEVFYELNAVGYAIHSWQLGTLRILLKHGCKLSSRDRQHLLRISGNDQMLLDELMAINADPVAD